MIATNRCPRCTQQIDSSRLNGAPVVCDSCGNVLSPTQKVSEERMERSFLIAKITTAIFMVAGFIHVANWGSESLNVIAFKVGEIAGGNSPVTIERMARKCLEMKKYDCTEKLYAKLAETDPRQYARLGKFQVSLRKYKPAVDNFRRFFAGGGGDIEANYFYAKALGEVGEITEAARHFDYVLSAKPDVVQITVLQNYVRYLMDANQLDHAKKVIEKVRSRDQTVSSFMESELRSIIQRQGGRA